MDDRGDAAHLGNLSAASARIWHDSKSSIARPRPCTGCPRFGAMSSG